MIYAATRPFYTNPVMDSSRKSSVIAVGYELSIPALLHKLSNGQVSPFPRRIYPTAFVTGMPRAV